MSENAVEHAENRLDSLSARELTVLEMLSLALPNSEMAHRLAVALHAVKFHLSSIYHKLGVTNRTEAAVVYLRDGLPAGSKGGGR